MIGWQALAIPHPYNTAPDLQYKLLLAIVSKGSNLRLYGKLLFRKP
jgi:hypothetical protein